MSILEKIHKMLVETHVRHLQRNQTGLLEGTCTMFFLQFLHGSRNCRDRLVGLIRLSLMCSALEFDRIRSVIG